MGNIVKFATDILEIGNFFFTKINVFTSNEEIIVPKLNKLLAYCPVGTRKAKLICSEIHFGGKLFDRKVKVRL